MKQSAVRRWLCLAVHVLLLSLLVEASAASPPPREVVLKNKAFVLSAVPSEAGASVRLHDVANRFDLANGAYRYWLSRRTDDALVTPTRLKNVTIKSNGDRLTVTGTLDVLKIEQVFTLPKGRPWMEERIRIHNPSKETVTLADLKFGFTRVVSDDLGVLSGGMRHDRFVAIPFRHRPNDPVDLDIDFTLEDLKKYRGRERQCSGGRRRFGYHPAEQWASDGWAWQRGSRTVGIFKFNQDAIEFSTLALEPIADRLHLRFGGAAMVDKEPGCLRKIAPGRTIDLGVTRYVSVPGDYTNAYYAFRRFLDERRCRFGADYNPPVQWNELYDNPYWHLSGPRGSASKRHRTRKTVYALAAMEAEAVKARAYGCEALYLDPGWDTHFGSFVWGTEWLGPQENFTALLRKKYDLKLALHCPLASWVARSGRRDHVGAPLAWPKEAYRKDRHGKVMPGMLCLGSKQYLDEAAKRLIALCDKGAGFIMFDGNDFHDGCWDKSHGHPIPYTKEAHCRANLELARRVHAKHPNVLIEMHDMMLAGKRPRYLPIYYKYGLPGSYNETWGFEFMWYATEDIRSGRARSLYYYNLACNIPLYLHIDLRDDNLHCQTLWWYASTCRHLGLGGTHSDPIVVRAQQAAMQKYRKLERFFKRGDFYGMNGEVHVHVLPKENALVINLFNLSDRTRVVSGRLDLRGKGLDLNRWYARPKGGHIDLPRGILSISRQLEPWACEVWEVKSYAVE